MWLEGSNVQSGVRAGLMPAYVALSFSPEQLPASPLHLRLWWWWRQGGGSLSTSPYIWEDLIQIEHIKLKHEKRFSDKQCNWASWELLLKILEKTIDYSREGQTLEPWSTHIYYLLQLKSNNISSDWTAQTVWHAVWGCFGGAGGCLGGAWQVLRTF